MPMQVILLERVDNLGNLGDVVKVKPGFARNYLIPQSKALRATPDNIAYFESKKKDIEKQNEAKKKDAEKNVKKVDGIKVAIIRHASEAGQLYGSVSARDIADAVAAKSGLEIVRSMIVVNNAFKTIGLFPVTVALHPEVKVEVTVNVARSEEEAKLQEKSGKALIAENQGSSELSKAEADAALEEVSRKAKQDLMEETALQDEEERSKLDAEESAEEKTRSAEKSAARAAKKKAVAAEEAEAAAEAGETDGE